MQNLIGRSRGRVLALAATCFATLVAASPAAAASSHCAPQASAPVFARFGDNANYSVLSGGSFQGSLNGWTLSKATVITGGEPWHVSGNAATRALQIAAGGYAVTPAFCVDNTLPYWRFFAQSTATTPGNLYVAAQWSDGLGHSGIVPDTTLDPSNYASWAPTPAITLGSVLPPGVTVTVRLVFYAAGGPWTIDDVYVDPYAKG